MLRRMRRDTRPSSSSGSPPALTWRVLTRADVMLAYPLVLVTGGGLDAAGWAAAAEAWLDGGTDAEERGIAVLTARADTIVALFFFRLARPLPCRFHVSMPHVLEPTATPKVLAATLRAASELASQRSCAELRVELDRADALALDLEEGLERLSAQLELGRTGRCWSRRLARAEVSSLAERRAHRHGLDHAASSDGDAGHDAC